MIDNISPQLWGPKWWHFLFAYSLSFGNKPLDETFKTNIKDTINGIMNTLPCEMCRIHAKEYRQKNKLVFNTGEDLFIYLYKMSKNIKINSNDYPEPAVPSMNFVRKSMDPTLPNKYNSHGLLYKTEPDIAKTVAPLVLMGVGGYFAYKYYKH